MLNIKRLVKVGGGGFIQAIIELRYNCERDESIKISSRKFEVQHFVQGGQISRPDSVLMDMGLVLSS